MKQNWQYKKLGEVCDVRDGTHDSPKYQLDGIPLITSKNLINGVIEFDNVNYISEYDANNINKRSKVEIGDIIMPMIGTIGNPVINNSKKQFCIKNVALIKFLHTSPRNNYIYFLLSSKIFEEYVKKNNKGGTQKFLSLGLIRDLIIPIPPIAEQEKIVAELDLLSGIIEKQKQQLKELDTLAQSIFYSMFGDPISNEKNWEKVLLKEVCLPKKDIKRASKFYQSQDNIIYIDISSIDNIANLIVNPSSYLFKDAPSRAQLVVTSNDILVSMVRPNLRNVAMILNENNNLVASSGFCVLRSKPHIDPKFLFFIVKTDNFTEYLINRVAGANYPAVREEDILGYKTFLPPLSLQNQFAEKIEKIEKQKEAINKSIEETQKLFDYTMDKYFG